MFNKPANIIISYHKICFFSKQDDFQCTKIAASDWLDKNKIADFLDKLIKQKKWKKTQLFLSGDLCYQLILKVGKDEIVNHDLLKRKLPQIIPEKTSKLLWKWQLIDQDEKNKWLQVLAIDQEKRQLVKNSIHKIKNKVEAIKAYDYEIAQNFKTYQEPLVLLISNQDDHQAFLVYKSGVDLVKSINLENINQELSALFNMASDLYDQNVRYLFLTNENLLKRLDPEQFSIVKLKKQDFAKLIKNVLQISKNNDDGNIKFDLNEFLKDDQLNKASQKQPSSDPNLAGDKSDDAKQDSYKSQDDIDISQQSNVVGLPENKTLDKNRKRSKKNKKIKQVLTLIILLLILSGLIIFAYFRMTRKIERAPEQVALEQNLDLIDEENNSEINPGPESGQEAGLIVEEENQTVQNFDPSTYSIQILNGSGIAGEAAKVEATLEAAGYTQIDTANAERFDYQQTVIQVDDIVLKEKIIELLEADYELSATNSALPTNSNFDLVITIGSSKK